MSTREAEIREHVSQAYTRAVTTPGGGCCGGMKPEQKGVAVKCAGYGEDLADLPADAVENSFGCGNPLAFSEVRVGDTVIDLGSGAGIDLLIAAKKTGPTGRVIGIDMTDAMIARANANIADAGVSDYVEVRKGLIENLPVDSGTVDWVISNCVINLSPEKDKVFAEIARVLKPGGRMLVSDIVVDSLPEELRRNQALYNSCVAGAISEKDYLAGLRKAGLTDVEVRKRHVYDDCQLEALIESEIVEPSERKSGCGCGCAAPVDVDVAQMATRAAGKVASISVYARKA
ncbi:MAG: arsenite methyltransferase [Phycisphaerales bacterium]|nr:arsenite methyltransferase [Phycisphaerales bacterium]